MLFVHDERRDLSAAERGVSLPGKHGTMETVMAREHNEGDADKLKGGIKEVAGKLTGDRELEEQGKGDQAKGNLKKAVGSVKDAVRDATRK